MAELIVRAHRLGLAGGELSLVHENNRAVRHLILACGGTRTKTFRLYRKSLAGPAVIGKADEALPLQRGPHDRP